MQATLTPSVTTDLKEIVLVQKRLEEVIQWALKVKNRNGYFACLYKNITGRVKEAILRNEFEDGERMVKFVVTFADYYLHALAQYNSGSLDYNHPWYIVFEKGKSKKAIVQHMLLGVNTHINYDLPNTCMDIAPGSAMITLCNDYVKINSILSQSISFVERQVFQLSPLLAVAGKLLPKFERQILNFSINVARSKSWECACLQALANEEEQQNIRTQSRETTLKITQRILSPGILANPFIHLVNWTEVRGMRRNLEVLRNA